MNYKCSISLIPEYRSVKPLPIRNGCLNRCVISGVTCLLPGPIRVSVSTGKLREFRLSCLIFSLADLLPGPQRIDYRQIQVDRLW